MNNRQDLYRNIHKAIRAMLSELVCKAGRVDFNDPAGVDSLRHEVGDIFELLEGHAHLEDTFVMPALREAAPQLARQFDKAHDDQEAFLPVLQARLEAIVPGSPEAPQQGHAFVVNLARLAGDLLMHMSDEESEINPALWNAYTDEQLIDIERRLVGSVPPEKMARYLRWMLPSLNGAERVGFLGHLPPPVFDFARAMARQLLSPADDAALEQGLNAVMQPA